MSRPVTIRLTSLEGNRQSLDGGAMFGNVPRELWQTWHAPDAKGRIALACRSLLAQTDDHCVLFEAGIGAFFDPKLASRYGVEGSGHQLLTQLEAAGLLPEAITHVVLSHLHFDHAGGLLPAFGSPTMGELVFPHAKIVVGARAWQRALHPHPRDRASFLEPILDAIQNSGRLVVIPENRTEGPDELAHWLEFRYTDGHTPGQMHSLIHEAGRCPMLFAGDLVPGTAWVHLPVTMGYDRFAELVIDEKKAIYDEALAGSWMLFFTHDPQVAASTLARDERGRFSATGLLSKLTSMELPRVSTPK